LKKGVLPLQVIKEMIKGGSIIGAGEADISPASLDLPISDEIYRVEGIFQTKLNERVRDILERIRGFSHDLKFPLERGVVYLSRLGTSLNLPESVYCYCNPKSSTGRNDIHVRVLADGVPRYDTGHSGYKGDLWIAISPKSYGVKLYPGDKLSQMRFFNEDTCFDETELQIAFEHFKLLWLEDKALSYDEVKIRDNDGSVILTANLSGKVIGYQCFGSGRVLDFSYKEKYQVDDFFTPICSQNGIIYLKRDGFYILSTKERIRVPPCLACEIIPMDHRTGELRSHYAGFFDPGWGYGVAGEGQGRPATLEVRPFEDLIIRDGQPIAKAIFEKMSEEPEKHYDQLSSSHYKDQQKPRLSKHFVRDTD